MDPAVSDRVRTYSREELGRLHLNLTATVNKIHRGELQEEPPTLDLLCSFHRELFSGVRDHAGKVRAPGFGSEYLTFGPNRSSSNRDVPNQLLDLFRDFQTRLARLESQPEAPEFEGNAIRLAAQVHADVIRIHPFEDGTGRSSRLLLNWTLVRLGLRPIAIEATKQEYCECLNHYFETRDINPLVDLCIRLSGPPEQKA